MRHAATLLCLPLLAAAALSCAGDRWSEEWEARYESIQPVDQVLDLMEIRPGMAVGEIGAGNGRVAVRIAARVGPAGTVYANDIDPRALRFMRRRAERERIGNLVVVRGDEVEPRFPVDGLDLVYIINTYDHLSDPVRLLRNTVRHLRPNGRLVIFAYDPGKLQEHRGHAVPEEVVVAQVERAGYALLATDRSLPYDNVYVFRPAGERVGPRAG